MTRNVLYFLAVVMLATIPFAANAKKDVTKYKGTVGPYAITMTLTVDGADALSSYQDVTGSYTYDKAQNTLRLEGSYGAPWSDSPGYYLEEYTAKGKNSGVWKLKDTNTGLQGTFQNLSNGKKFKVTLRRVK